ncbi:MAG TPA: hypothetical protein VFY45_19965 [Baekduia sp.]|nr:hypothetical protein [Baekduia sp.]
MAGATGAQSSITNSRSATANLGLGELCPSLGTLVYAALQRRLEHKPSTGSGPWWGSPAALREPGRTGHVR